MSTNMPGYAFTDLDLAPELGTTHARTQGGLVVTSRNADPFWRGTMTTKRLNVWGSNNEHADFLAWLIWAVDNNMRVDFVHPRHRVPRNYSVENWPMPGNGSLVATPDMRTLSVSGIPIGVKLKRGDRVSVGQGDIIVHRWIAADTLVESAINQNVPVTPRLPIGILAPAASVLLKDPKLRFMIVPRSISAAEEGDLSSISFEVMEALR